MNRMVASQSPTLHVSEGELLRQIDHVKDYIHTHKEQLPTHFFNAFDGLSRTALGYKNAGSNPNWLAKVVDSAGNPLWTGEEAIVLEEALPVAAQVGGANFRFTPGSSLILPKDYTTPSIDEMVKSVQEYLAALDAKNRELAKLVGPVAYINSMKEDPVIQGIPIPSKAILPIINAILESCRLLVSNNTFDSPTLRKILSIILAIFDVSRGEWRNGILSAIGVFGQSFMIYGMIGKAARWVYNFISPDIQSRIEEDLLDGTKSAIIGSWLWLISILSPDYVRATVNSMVETVKLPLEELNKKIDAMEQQAQQQGDAMGVTVTFPRLPLDKIPSFDDIQNFQTLLHQPAVFCSPVFQQAIKPALDIPVLRIALELMDLPIQPAKLAEKCVGQPATLEEAVTQQLKPTIVPKVVGGGKRKTRKRSRH
jgi:hypothetical protein